MHWKIHNLFVIAILSFTIEKGNDTNTNFEAASISGASTVVDLDL